MSSAATALDRRAQVGEHLLNTVAGYELNEVEPVGVRHTSVKYSRRIDAERIRHTVAFTLIHAEGSAGERDFLDAAKRLATVPGVEVFELLAEVSRKNGYRFAISMEFADRLAYQRYNQHPDHLRFVQEHWLSDVSEFLELDYAAR